MKRLVLVSMLALAPLGVIAATAAADNPGTGGVSIETGNPWNVFQPTPVAPDGSVNITVTTFQDQAEGANATVTFTGFPSGVSFTSNGDTSAACVGTVACTYTDYAHSAKSDNYTFNVGSGVPLGTYPIGISVDVQGVGAASETVPLVVGPNSTAQCKNGGWQTWGVFKNQGDCVSYVATKGTNPPG